MNIEQARTFAATLKDFIEEVDSHHKVAEDERLTFQLYDKETDEYIELKLHDDNMECFNGFEFYQLSG